MQLPFDFLSAVLPSQGHRVFAAIFPGPPGNRPTMELPADAGHENAQLSTLAWALTKQADLYVAIGGFGPAMRQIKSGRRTGQWTTSREASNSEWHRSLRIDIDCGTGKPYADKKAGWAAAKQFITACGLPMPLVVDSGYGLHVYWLLDRDTDRLTWQNLSLQLERAVAHHALAVDSTTTCDAARILRLPGSLNFKYGTAVDVRKLCDGDPRAPEWYAQQLASYGPVMAQGPRLQGVAPRGSFMSDSPLSANMHPTYGLRGALTQCPGLAAMIMNHGAQAAEPLWRAALSLVHKADDADDKKLRVARALSDGHPSFSEGEFLAKWDQVIAQDYEPPTCDTFARLGMPECRSCPLRATCKSPVVLGRAAPPVQNNGAAVPIPAPVVGPVVGPTLPPPPTVTPSPMVGLQAVATTHGIFAIMAGTATVGIVDGNLTTSLSIENGIPCVLKMEMDPATGQMVRTRKYIGSYRIIEAERLLDKTNNSAALVSLTFCRNTDGFVKVEFDHAALSEGRAFNGLLARYGIHMSSTDSKLLQDRFMPEFLAQLQRIKEANLIASRCGWTDNFNKFVLGTQLYTSTTQEAIRPSGSQNEIEAYHEAGNEAEWRKAFDIVLAGGFDRQAIVALGLAAPLMAFTGVDGVLLNAYSPQSGVGKSTLCDAILSVWGSPDKLRKDFRDTPAATFHLAAISGNLPMVIDEFTNVDGKELSNYIYTITQGRERHRLSSDAKLRDNVNRWCLPAIATSNRSVHAKLQDFRIDAAGEAARVFEMRLYPLQIDPHLMGAAKRQIDALKHNYGFLGPRLVRIYMTKGEAYWRQKVSERIAWWDSQMADDTSDRFRTVLAALIELGAVIGQALGFNFDRAGIIDAVKSQWRQQVQEFEQARMHPQDFVANYIAENINKLVVFGDGNLLPANFSQDYVGELRGIRKNSQQMAVQSVLIPARNLRDFVTQRNGDYKAVVEWINRETQLGGMAMRIGQMTFLAGTPKNIRMQGFEFNGLIMGQPVVVSATPPTIAPVALRHVSIP